MSNFLILLKANIINTFALNKLLKKNKEGNVSIFASIFVGIVALLMFVFFGFYMLLFGSVFNQGGNSELILLVGITFASLMSVITTITKANAYLFRAKDFEMLMALPIKPTTIISTKLTNLYLINLLWMFYCYIPSVIVYAIYNVTGVWYWVTAIIALFILPLFPITICSVISYLFGFIPLKKKIKNFFSIIFSLVFIVVVMSGSFSSSAMEEDPTGVTNSLANILNKAYFLGVFAFSGIKGNLISYLLFVGISVVLFGLFIYVVGLNYLKANNKNSSGETVKNFKLKGTKATSQAKAFLKKEITKYFGSPAYVMNTICGPVISTVAVIALSTQMNQLISTDANMIKIVPLIIMVLIIFMVSLTTTSACSLSLEGKNFWIIKSAPIPTKTVFFAKIAVNIIVTIPFIIIDTILCAILMKFNALELLAILVIPSIFAISISILGLYANLLIPRFDYDQEIKAIKQSMSVLVTMGFCFLISLLLVGAVVLGIVVLGNVTAAYIASLLLGVLVLAISIALISTSGIKKYNRLNC